MKFKLTKAGDWNFEEEVEISNLKDILDLIEKYDTKLIIDKDEIMIYDGCIEWNLN